VVIAFHRLSPRAARRSGQHGCRRRSRAGESPYAERVVSAAVGGTSWSARC